VLRAFIVVAPLFLCGCVNPTPYQPMDWTGGVSAEPITSDTFRIVARGNGVTYSEMIKDYALLKAAETTIAAGCTHFLVLDADNQSTTTTHTTPGTVTTRVSGSSVRTEYDPGVTSNIHKPGQDLTIKVLKIEPGKTAPTGAYLAEEVLKNVSPRVPRI
jgi:hypothetical protein